MRDLSDDLCLVLYERFWPEDTCEKDPVKIGVEIRSMINAPTLEDACSASDLWKQVQDPAEARTRVEQLRLVGRASEERQGEVFYKLVDYSNGCMADLNRLMLAFMAVHNPSTNTELTGMYLAVCRAAAALAQFLHTPKSVFIEAAGLAYVLEEPISHTVHDLLQQQVEGKN